MSDLRTFLRDLDDFAERVGLEQRTIVKKIAFDLFGAIVKRTPVDTGRARASWTIAVGSANRAVQPEGEYPAYQQDRETVAQVAQAAAQQEIAGFFALAGLKKGVITEPIWISNNLPYIVELEQGHSKDQAPNGMVDLAILDVEQKLAAELGVR